jgi:phage terminase small subunit
LSLTPKQEAFAHKYVETGNASQSYRFAYNAESMLPATIWDEASRTLALPHVSHRITELQERSLASTDITAADIARTAWKIASDEELQPSARVSALALLAKRHPEFSDKHDVSVDVRAKALIAVANMTEEQLLRLAALDDEESIDA